MKSRIIFGSIAILLLIAGVLLLPPNHSSRDGQRLSGKASNRSVVRPVSGTRANPVADAHTRKSGAAQSARPAAHGHRHREAASHKTVYSSRLIEEGFIAGLASGGAGSKVSIPLTNGRSARGILQIVKRDENGRPTGISGRITSPSPGGFVFNEEPPESIIAPMFGAVYFFEEGAHAYRAEPTGDGTASLLELPADEVVCILRPPEDAEASGNAPETLEAMGLFEDHPEDIPVPDYQHKVVPLQSNPGASAVIYLDFDGEKGPFFGWGGSGTYDTTPGSDLSFENIMTIWKSVAEDYSPFNINVTTDEKVFDAAPQGARVRMIITSTNGRVFPRNAVGVALLGSYRSTGDIPCFSRRSVGKSAADTIAHELGHTFGLLHSATTTYEYYGGHGEGEVSWAPIMGSSQNKNLTQWSKDEYANARPRPKGNLAIIAGNPNVGFRPDDHGDTPEDATPLEVFPGGKVDDQGLIGGGTGDDVDVFSFSTKGGSLDLAIDHQAGEADLDILAEIHDSSGSLVVSSNPPTRIDAHLTANLPAGDYTLRISGTGYGDPKIDGYSSYGSLGQYRITGTIRGAVAAERFLVDENSPAGTILGTIAPRNDHGDHALSFSILSGSGAGAIAVSSGTGRLTVADASRFDYETLAPGWDDRAQLDLTVAVSDADDPSLDETIRLVVEVADVNEAPVLEDGSATIPSGLRAGSVVARLEVSETEWFQDHSWQIIAGDPGGHFAIDPSGALTLATPFTDDSPADFHLVIETTDSGTPPRIATCAFEVKVLGGDSFHYDFGHVLRTVYDGIDRAYISQMLSDPRFPRQPTRELELFELSQRLIGDRYGSTIRAYLVAPRTGDYTFWIAGSDECQFFLSPNTDPAAMTLRASVNKNGVAPQDWDNADQNGTQRSEPVHLVEGQIHYLEIRQKERTSSDHIALAWQCENEAGVPIPRQVVPATFLAPHRMAYAPTVTSAEAAPIYKTPTPDSPSPASRPPTLIRRRSPIRSAPEIPRAPSPSIRSPAWSASPIPRNWPPRTTR